MALQVGSPAPRFVSAPVYLASMGQFSLTSLEDYRGRWLCLYFYPNDFSTVCPTELVAFDRVGEEFRQRDCDLLGCSTDSELAHRTWCQTTPELRGLRHPLMSDSRRTVSLDYGVYLADPGVALRGTFLIDPGQVLRWMCVNDLNIGRSTEEILRVLDALQTDDLCPCNWRKGQPTLKRT